MDRLLKVEKFVEKVKDDPRITTAHISLYVALVCMTGDEGTSLKIFSYEVMPVCKISGSGTYHRCIRQLDEFGYIKYFPSYNHNKGSRVEFVL